MSSFEGKLVTKLHEILSQKTNVFVTDFTVMEIWRFKY